MVTPKKTSSIKRRASSASSSISAEDVALYVLRRIMSGEFAPGERLPGQSILRAQMCPTLDMTKFNRGVAILKERGFIHTQNRSFSQVADPLPHRNRFAMVLPQRGLHSPPTSLFSVHRYLAQAYMHEHPEKKIHIYYYEPHDPFHAESVETLAHQIRWHEVAGVLFTCYIRHSEKFFNEPGIARVRHQYDSTFQWPWMKSVPYTQWPTANPGDFLYRALEQVRESGPLRTAILRESITSKRSYTPNVDHEDWTPVLDQVRQLGLNIRPEWLLNVWDSGWETSRLLLQDPNPPEVFIIADDKLVEPVTAGIASSPKPWPTVIALANFPVLPKHHVPVSFIGFDIGAMFDWCMRTLQDPEAQKRTPVYQVEAITEYAWRNAGGIPQYVSE